MTDLGITLVRKHNDSGKKMVCMMVGNCVVGQYVEGAAHEAPMSSDIRRACREELAKWRLEEEVNIPGHTVVRENGEDGLVPKWRLVGRHTTFATDEESIEELENQIECSEVHAQFFRWVAEKRR